MRKVVTPMPTITPTRTEAARKEISGILRRYRLRWNDVAPDVDETIWNEIAPTARKIRQNLFRSRYPKLAATLRSPR